VRPRQFVFAYGATADMIHAGEEFSRCPWEVPVESSPIETYDLLMLIVLVGATIFGAWKGMAWQLASLASVVVSVMVAMQFGATLAPYISQDERWNRFIAMLILYLVTSVAVWLAFRLVAGAIDRVRLKDFDH
jgi:membrane protein required for colicin V production